MLESQTRALIDAVFKDKVCYRCKRPAERLWRGRFYCGVHIKKPAEQGVKVHVCYDPYGRRGVFGSC